MDTEIITHSDITMTSFSNSAEVYQYLRRFIDFDRGRNLSFQMDRMKTLMTATGHPERCAPALHVTGSKGKGSVTGMAAAILSAAGLHPAVYSSPHVIDFRERVCTPTSFFDESVYTGAGDELRTAATSVLAEITNSTFDPWTETGHELAFFELATTWFFLCARRAGCGAMAIEVGLGGRLDATNIVDPVAAAITPVELEHTEFLGTTIAAIASEKAGVIKPGRPVVLAEQPPDALAVFKRVAEEVGSPLIYFPDHGTISNLRVTADATIFTLDLHGICTFTDLEIAIPGEIQAHNAGQAVLLVKTAFPQIDEATIRSALKTFSLPARFERVADQFVVDGAHTARSTRECAKTFVSLYGEGGVLIFGCVLGKDVRTMAENLVAKFSHVIVTTPGMSKKSNPKETYDVCVDVAQGAVDVEFVPDTGEAVVRAMQIGNEKRLPILGTGSFYLASEIRQWVLNVRTPSK
jgi:dihydrofolate synthase/folylpolyglutamate synthase